MNQLDEDRTRILDLAPEEAVIEDFRQFLREALIARCKSNPAYSLRAFAKQLGLEPSYLSKLLSGKRNITEKIILKTTGKLSLGPGDVQKFLTHAKRRRATKVGSDQPLQYQSLAVDHFKIVADWYHYAILELLLVDGFDSDPKWIAEKLGITKLEAESALERLERLEMLKRDENGRYISQSVNHTTLGNDFTAVAFRKLQKQILLQALNALENLPMDRRDQSSMTMAIDASMLGEAKKKIKNFRRELCEYLQDNPNPKNHVYQLSVSLFPVTDSELKAEI